MARFAVVVVSAPKWLLPCSEILDDGLFAMKTLGLIGGMSCESTATYYSLLNKMTRERLGGIHSARLLLWSFDFAEIEALRGEQNWAAAAGALARAARSLEQIGADALIICTNTMHIVADDVQKAIRVPLIHIADATATAIVASESKRPLLLGTRYTMEQTFYRRRLQEKYGIDAMVPSEPDRITVNRIIYDELCRGITDPSSKQRYLDIVRKGICAGADGVIFGCTEINLLLSANDFSVPTFDTTYLHAAAALDFALAR